MKKFLAAGGLLISFFIFATGSLTAQNVNVTSTSGTATTGSYTSISAAFAKINDGTHKGDIVLTIINNFTEAGAVTPLTKSGNATASSYTSVTIKPSGDRVVTGTATSNRGIIELNGADNVTIDGDDPSTAGTRNLTLQFTTTGTTVTSVIRVCSNSTTGADGANNNTVKNCILTGSRAVGGTTNLFGINQSNYSTSSSTTGGYSCLNNRYENNYITKVYHGIWLTGGSSSYPNIGTKVINNVMGNGTAAGNIGQRGVLISNSAVTFTQAPVEIYGNDIQGGDPGTTGYASTIAGIEIGTANYGIRVYKNYIHDIKQPSTSGYGAIGIYVTGSTSCDSVRIYNNIIRGMTASNYASGSRTSTFVNHGVLMTAGATNMYFDHNTIVIDQPNISGTSTNPFSGTVTVTPATGGFAAFRNNILVNNYAYSNSHVLYLNNTGNVSNAVMNGNVYYAGSGTPLLFVGSAMTLSQWQAASGKDLNSFNVQPNFVSGFDLHINSTTSSLLESGGVSGTGISTDYDGDARPGPTSVNGGGTANDIGADEFDAVPVVPVSLSTPTASPSGTQCTATSRSISAIVTRGSNAISSVTLNYSYNGVAQTPIAMTAVSGDYSAQGDVSSWSATIPAATPSSAIVTWSVTVVDGAVSRTLAGTSYYDDPIAGVVGIASASPVNVCTGNNTSLSLEVTLNGANNGKATVGLGASTNSIPLYGLYQNNKSQTLYRGSELRAAGFRAGNITSLGLIFTAVPSVPMYDFNISIGNTTDTMMASTYFATTSLTPVYSVASYAPFLGENRWVFATPFYWDGSSNIIVQFCHGNVSSTTNNTTTVRSHTAPFTAMAYKYLTTASSAATVCAQTVPTSSTTGRAQIIFGGTVAVTPVSVSWSDGTSTVASGTPASVAVTTNTEYTATITMGGGCTTTSDTANATVIALPSSPSGTGSLQCGYGIPSASVSGGATANSYRWYLAATGGTALAGEDSTRLKNYNISAPTTFYVAIFDGTCESVRTAVFADVVAPDPISATTAAGGSICIGVNDILNVANIANPVTQSYVYTWRAIANATNAGMPDPLNGNDINITPLAAGTYNFEVAASSGVCNTRDTVQLIVKALPVIDVKYSPAAVCAGDTIKISGTTPITNSGKTVLGSGSTTSSSGYSPFYAGYGGLKNQWIWTATELKNLGLAAGNITSLAFEITVAAATPFNNFQISLGNTSQLSYASSGASAITSGLMLVYTGKGANNSVTAAVGTNTYVFDAPFYWDGVSNVVLQTCWSNGGSGSVSATTKMDAGTSSWYNAWYLYVNNLQANVVCPSTIGGTFGGQTAYSYSSYYRPQIKLQGQRSAFGAGTLSWSWNTGQSTASFSAVPIATTTYVATASDPATTCTNYDSVTVSVLSAPAAPAGTDATQCGTNLSLASIASNSGAGSPVFNWYGINSNPVWTTYYFNDFDVALLGPDTLSGNAQITNGQAQLTSNNANQLGGIAVNPIGVNIQELKVSFNAFQTSTIGADGFSYSFGDDVSATSTAVSAETGSGTKLSISFDSYGAANANGASGIRVIYGSAIANNPSINPGTNGVLAYVRDTSWIGSSNNFEVYINSLGQLTLRKNGAIVFNNIQLPAAYVSANKASWKHVFKARTGAIFNGHNLDDLIIQYRNLNYLSSGSTYPTPVSATTTFYVAELGSNGCISSQTPVTATVIIPDSVAITATEDTLCLNGSSTLTVGKTTNTIGNNYSYVWSASPSTGSGLPATLNGTSISVTPTAAGTYVYSVAAIDSAAGCANAASFTVRVNGLPSVDSIRANKTAVCSGDSITLYGFSASIGNGPQTLPTGYCGGGGSTTTGDEQIFSFSFGAFTNAPAEDCAENNKDYTTSLPALTVVKGQSYSFSVTTDECNGSPYYSNGLSIFVDFNRDGDFDDAGEIAFTTTATTTSPNTRTGNITIPANAAGGLTRMRVKVQESVASPLPCATFTYGEVEDYTLNILTIIPVNPSLTYTWNPDGATSDAASFAPSASGPYTLTVTDTNGCTKTSTDSINVTVFTRPAAAVGTDTTQCGAGVSSAFVSGTGNFRWYDAASGGVLLQDSSLNSFAGNILGTTTLYVATYDGTCESAPRTAVTTTITPAPEFTIAGNKTICNGATDSLTVLTGLLDYGNVTWSPASGLYLDAGLTTPYTLGVNAFTVYVSRNIAGSIAYTATASGNDGGCRNIASAVITVLPSVMTISSPDTLLCNGGIANMALIPSGGYGFGNLKWQISADQLSWNDIESAASVTLSIANNAASYYRVELKDGTGNICGYSSSIYIEVPAVVSTIAPVRCGPGSVTYQATGTSGSEIRWYSTATGGVILDSGSTYTTNINSTSTFYATAISNRFKLETGGTVAPFASTTGTTSTNNYGMVFTATKGFVLKSVDLIAVTGTSCKVQLWNTVTGAIAASNIVYTTPTLAILSDGASNTINTIHLNWHITPGSYRIMLTDVVGTFRRDFDPSGTNFSYPMSLGTVGTINAYAFSTGNSNTSNYIYYFYNYKIAPDCESPRVAVTATVTTPPSVTAQTSLGTLCEGQSANLSLLTDNASYAYSWNGTLIGANHTVTPNVTTKYLVTAVDSSGGINNGCNTKDSITITVGKYPVNVNASVSDTVVCAPGNAVSLTGSAVNADSLDAGYNLVDSSGVSFIDIKTTGTAVTGAVGDDTEHGINLPFAFTYNKVPYTTALVGNNGAMVFGTTTGDITYTNSTLPTSSISAGNAALLPLWDDMTPITDVTSIKTQKVGSKFIIQWTEEDNFNATGSGTVTFQIQLDSATGNIHFVYDDVLYGVANADSGKLATVGLNYTATTGLQYSYNAASLYNGKSITFTPKYKNITSYSWTSIPAGYTSSTQNPVGVPVSVNTQFVLTATSVAGCSTSDTTMLVKVTDLDITAEKTDVVCKGASTGTIIASATGGYAPYQFSLNGSNYSTSNIFDGNPAGSYWVYIKDSKNCMNSFSISIAEPATLVYFNSIFSANPICYGSATGIINVTAEGGTGIIEYSLNGTTYQATGSFTGLAAATYTVYARDASLCVTTASVTLTNPAKPTLVLSNSTQVGTVCAGQDVTLRATDGYVSYVWTGPGVINNNTYSVATAVAPANGDKFYVAITDANGCTNNDSTVVNITANLPVSVSISVFPSTEICVDETVKFTATPTNGGATPVYAWYVNSVLVPDSTGATFTSSTLTDGSVVYCTLASSITCTTGSPATSNSETISISSFIFPAATLSVNDSSVCAGTSVTFTAGGTGLGSTPTYEFFVNATSVQTSGSNTYSYVPLDGDQVTVTITSSFTCALGGAVTSSAVVMNVDTTPVAPSITVTGDTVFCNGGSVTLTSSYTGGNTWSTAETTDAITVTTSGSYSVTFITAEGCTSPASAPVTVLVNANPTVNISGSSAYCNNSNVTLTANATAGSGTITSYQWSLNGTTALGTDATQTANAVGSYTVTVTNSNGCSTTSAGFSLSENTALVADVSNTGCTSLYEGHSTTLVATPSAGVTYAWSLNGTPVAGTSASYTTAAFATGTYVVTVTDGNGCQDTASIVVAAATAPIAGGTTWDIPGNCATSGFSSLASAVKYLNTYGVTGSGAITFNVAAGYTETAPKRGIRLGSNVFNASQTAATPITFQRASAGTNPLITAGLQDSASLVDAVILLRGADYITFDAIDVAENFGNTVTTSASNRMTEFGYALMYHDTTNGAQYNTIRNCNISLDRSYTNAIGIYSNARHNPDSLNTKAVTDSINGPNSYNQIVGNNISNVNAGIWFVGDSKNGFYSLGNRIHGNTIANYGSQNITASFPSVGLMTGIGTMNLNNDTITNNTITSANISTAGTNFRGIVKTYSTFPSTRTNTVIDSNTITLNSALASGTMNGISVQNTTSSDLDTLSTLSISGNRLLNFTITGASSSTGVYGIENNMRVGSLRIVGNTIRGINTTSTTGTSYMITNTAAVMRNIEISDNKFGDATAGLITFQNANSGIFYVLNNTGANAAANVAIANNDTRGINYTKSSTATQYYYYSTGAGRNVRMSNNTLTKLNIWTSGTMYMFYLTNSCPAGGFKNLDSNRIVGSLTRLGKTGTVYGAWTSGSSATGSILNIRNNDISNISLDSAITFYGVYSTDGTTTTGSKFITGNTVTNVNRVTATTSTAIVYGLMNTYAGDSSVIANNTINNITSNGAGGVIGMNLTSSGNSARIYSINNNTVTNLNALGGSTGGTVKGIVCANTSSNVVISNNTLTGYTANAVSANALGIEITGGTNTRAYGNTINNIVASGTTSPTLNAVVVSGGTLVSVDSNIINNLRSSGTASAFRLRGVQVSGGTTVNVRKNKIYDVAAVRLQRQAGVINGIEATGGTTVNIVNNMVADIKSDSASIEDAIRGISVTSTTANGNYNVYYNTVHLNATSVRDTFGTSAMYHTTNATATTAQLTMRNNIFVNKSGQKGPGRVVAYRRSSAAKNNYNSNSNNNLFYAGVPAARNLLYYGGASTDSVLTLDSLKSKLSARETASITEDLTFLSTTGSNANFLKPDPADTSGIEGGAAFIAGIDDDLEGTIRQGSLGYAGTSLSGPDMGADEYEGLANACTGSNAGVATIKKVTVCSINTMANFTHTGVSIGSGIVYSWEGSLNGSSFTAVSVGSGANTPSYTTPNNLTAGTYYYRLVVSCGATSGSSTSGVDTLVVNQTPTTAISSNSPVCSGDSLKLFANVSDTSTTTYAWTGVNSFTSTLRNPAIALVSLSAAGKYYLIATRNGCASVKDSTVVTVNESPTAVTITPTNPVLCIGDTLMLRAGGGKLIGNAVTVYSENFNAATNDWTVTSEHTSGSSPVDMTWSLRASPHVYGSYTLRSNDTTQFYLANSYIGGTGSVTKTILRSPAISTIGLDTATLTFATYYDYYTTSDTAAVEISTDNVTWTRLTRYTADQGAQSPFTNVSLGIPAAFRNQANVYIRFYYRSSYGYLWAIDNVRLTTPAALPITWSPTTNLFVDRACTIPYIIQNEDTVYSTSAVTRAYTASVVNSGCTKTAVAYVSAAPKPVATISGGDTLCVGSNSPAIVFTAAGGTAPYTFTYRVNGGAPQTTATIGGMSTRTLLVGTGTPGVFFYELLSVSDVNCSGTASGSTYVEVLTPPAPVISGLASNYCVADAVVSFGGNYAGGTFTGPGVTDNGDGTATFNPAVAGSGNKIIGYSFNNGACSGSTSKIVSLSPAVSAGNINGPATICYTYTGSTNQYQLTGATPGGLWYSSDSSVAIIYESGILSAVGSGSITIGYIVSGCGVDTSLLSVSIQATSSAGEITAEVGELCLGETTDFDTDGDAGGTWISSNSAIATVNSSTGQVSTVSAGTATISYLVIGQGTCPNDTASNSLTVSAPPFAGTISGEQNICVGNTYPYSVSGNSDVGYWENGNGMAAMVDSNGFVTAVEAGVTDIHYVVPGTGGCYNDTTFSSLITVSAPLNAGIVYGDSQLCIGSTSYFVADGESGGFWYSSDTAVATVDSLTGVVSAVGAGYSVIKYLVPAVGGCPGDTASQLITVSTSPVPGILIGNQTLCIGDTNTYVPAGNSESGFWESSDPAVAVVDAGGMVTGVAAGTALIWYVVQGTGGCLNDTAHLIVTVTAPPNSGEITSGDFSLCIGDSSDYDTDGDASGFWISSNEAVAMVNSYSGVVTALTAGTASIQYITIGSGGCLNDTATQILTVTAPPEAGEIIGGGSICVYDTATLIISGNSVAGSWESRDAVLASIDPNGMLTGINAGNVFVQYIVSGTGGCPDDTAYSMVTVTSTPNAGTISSSDDLICFGQGRQLATDGDVGGIWYSSESEVAIVNGSGMVTGLAPGNSTIQYIVSGLGGCTNDTAMVIITVKGAPAPGNILGEPSICLGSTTSYMVEGNSIAGYWSSSDTSIAKVDLYGMVEGVGAGVASISYTVTDCGEVRTASTQIKIKGSSFYTEVISACDSFTWHDVTYTSSNNSAIWIGENNAGCDSIVTLDLMINQPAENLISAQSCTDYLWNGQIFDQTGTYTWTGSTIHGCDSVVILSLTIDPALAPTGHISGISRFCSVADSAEVILNLTGVGPWSGVLSDGTVFNASMTPHIMKIYSDISKLVTIVSLSDANCQAIIQGLTGQAQIVVGESPSASLLGYSVFCAGDEAAGANLSLHFSGLGPWYGLLSDGSEFYVSAIDTTIKVYPTMSTDYYLISVVDSSCISQQVALSGGASVQIHSRPTAFISGSAVFCDGNQPDSTSVQIEFTGQAPWSGYFSDGTSFFSNQNVIQVNVPVTGYGNTFTVAYLVDQNCQSASDGLTGEALIEVRQRPTADISGDEIRCLNSTTPSLLNITVSGNGPWSGSLTDGTGFSGDISPIQVMVSPDSSSNYVIAELFDQSCAAQINDLSGIGFVNVKAPPSATIYGGESYCSNDSTEKAVLVDFEGEGPWNGFLSDGTYFSSDFASTFIYVNPSQTTIYAIDSLADQFCVADYGSVQSTTTITINPLPDLAIQDLLSSCGELVLDLNSGIVSDNSGMLTEFFDNQDMTSSVSEFVSTSGTYYVKVTDINGCLNAAEIDVLIRPQPLLSVSSLVSNVNQPPVNIRTAIISDTVGLDVKIFKDAAMNVEADPITFGSATYYVKVTNEFNCEAIDSFTVTVNDCPSARISGRYDFCEGSAPDSVLLTIDSLTGTGPWSGLLSDGTAFAGSESTINIALPVNGDISFSLISLSDANCSMDSSDFDFDAGEGSIMVHPRPVAQLSGSFSVCENATALLSIQASGTGPWSGTLSDGSSFSSYTPDFTVPVMPSTAGTDTAVYSIVTLSDANCLADSIDISGIATIDIIRFAIGDIAGPSNSCLYTGSLGLEAKYLIPTNNASVFNWTVPAGVTIISGKQTNELLVKYQSSFSAGNISVTVSGACGGPVTKQFAVSKTLPEKPSGISGPSVVCSLMYQEGDSTLYSVQADSEVLRYRWTLPAGMSVLSSNADSSQVYVGIGNNFKSANILTRAVSGCGLSVADSLNLIGSTNNAIVGDLPERCGPGFVTFNATAANSGEVVEWFDAASGGSLLYTGDAYSTSLASTTTLYAGVRNLVTGCLSISRLAVKATINPLPGNVASFSGATYCGSSIATISATAGAGNTIDWYADSSRINNPLQQGSLSGVNTYTTPALVNISTSFWAVQRNLTTGCVSPGSVKVAVQINSRPELPLANDAQRCGTGTVTLSAIPPAGSTVSWYSTAAGGTALANSNTYTTPVLSSSRSYYAESRTVNGGCASVSRKEVIVTILSLPAAPVTVSASRCGSGVISISASSISAGSTIDWYSAASLGTLLRSNSTTYDTFLTATRSYYAQSRNVSTGCVSSTRTIATATINALPTSVSTVSGTAQCGAAVVTVSATATTGFTIDWYADSLRTGTALKIGTLSGANTYTSPLPISTTTVYWVAQRNLTTGCVSAASKAVIATINPLPSAPSATGGVRCGTGTVVLTASAPSGITVAWFNVPTGGTALSTSLSYTTPTLSSTTNYYVQSRVTATGCISSTRTIVTAVINPLPASPVTVSGSSCGPGVVRVSATTSTGGAVIDWWNASSLGTRVRTASNNLDTFLTATKSFYAQSRNSTTGCVSSRIIARATVNSILPASTSLTGLINICPLVGTSTSTRYTATAVTGAASYKWTIPTGAVIDSGGTGLKIRVRFVTATANDSIFVQAIASSGCLGNKRVLKLTTTGCVTTIAKAADATKVEMMEVGIFPNPSSGNFNLTLKSAAKEDAVLSVFDNSGKMVIKNVIKPDEVNRFGQFLLPGMYYVEVRQGDKRVVRKVVRY